MDAESLKIKSAHGLWLYTVDGRRILDGISGTFNLPLGYNCPEVEDAVRKQTRDFSFLSSDLSYLELEELEDRLLQLGKPLGLDEVKLRDVVGSTAVEFAVKTAQVVTGNKGIISFGYSHHGQTVLTVGISGSDFRKSGISGTYLDYSYCVPLGTDRCDLEKVLWEADKKGGIAAVVVEPVLGNAGSVCHEEGYFDILKSFCKDFRILFIVDEVQTGIGRLAFPLGCMRYGIEPDMVVLGKGLGNGYPIAAVLYRKEHRVLEHYQHSFTCGAHPVSVAAANVTLSRIMSSGMMERASFLGKKLRRGLEELRKLNGRILEITGDSLMSGVRVTTAQFANEVVRIAKNKFDLRLRSSRDGFGNVVKVRPALVATDREIDELIIRLGVSLEHIRGSGE